MTEEEQPWWEPLREPDGFEREDGKVKIPEHGLMSFLAALGYVAARNHPAFLQDLNYAIEDPYRNMPFLLLQDEQTLRRLAAMLRLLAELWRTDPRFELFFRDP